jgi:hypothetical protein
MRRALRRLLVKGVKPAAAGAAGSVWPYTRTFEGDTTDALPADVTAYGASAPLVKTWYAGETEGWNPSGLSKVLQCNHVLATLVGIKVSLPENFSLTEDWNLEFLFTHNGDGHRGYTYGLIADNGSDGFDETAYIQHNTFEQQLQGKARTERGTPIQIQATGMAQSVARLYWVKARLELVVDGNSTVSLIRASNGSSLGTATAALDWEGKLAGETLSTIRFYHQATTSAEGLMHIGRIYLGKASDGWPSDS